MIRLSDEVGAEETSRRKFKNIEINGTHILTDVHVGRVFKINSTALFVQWCGHLLPDVILKNVRYKNAFIEF